MARKGKKPRANVKDIGMRNTIIVFAAVIFVIGAIMIINNRSLSFAGTLDGHRMPAAHYEFFKQQQVETIHFEMQMMVDDFMLQWASDRAFDNLVELHIIRSQARSAGITLTDEDMEHVDMLVEMYRSMYVGDGFNAIRDMGFTNASFRRFVELLVLQGRVFEVETEGILVSEEEVVEAFNEWVLENVTGLRDVFIYMVEADDEITANNLLLEMAITGDILPIMRENPSSFIPEPDEGEEPIVDRINIRDAGLFDEDMLTFFAIDDLETMEPAFGAGTLSSVIQLTNGNFGFFQVAYVEDVHDFDEMFENFTAHHESEVRSAAFTEMLNMWRSQSEYTRNARIFGR